MVEEKTQSIERETPSAAEKVFTVEEKVIEKTEFASQERSQAQEQKQEQEQVSEKPHKKNKLGQFIQKLRGIDVHAVTTNKDDKSKEIDITNQKSKEDKTADVAASTSRTAEGEKSKVSKRIKHLVNFARGIIQPKRTVASTNASQSNTHTQSQITKEIKDKLTQNTYDK